MALRAFDEDTIVAVATAPGQGGIGIVRLSGPRAVEIAAGLFEPSGGTDPADQPSHVVRHGRVWAGGVATGAPVDDALLTLMRAPRSYTREDVAEISAHGSPETLSRIVDEAVRRGARLALPGEFTKRAFLNGRLDLVQAEAVLDLIRARGEKARRWALGRLEGELSRRLASCKSALLDVLSRLEAAIDFPDDGLEPGSTDEIRERLETLEEEVRRLAGRAEWGLAAKEGWSVVITGKPNVGKSSLMNRLLGRDRVIVTPIAGTTRDVVEDTVRWGGFAVRLSDTAGLRQADHPLERSGIERTHAALAGADLPLAVFDASAPFDEMDEAVLAATAGRPRVLALNKSDLPAAFDPRLLEERAPGEPVVSCSALAKNGLDALVGELTRRLSSPEVPPDDEAVVGSVRQRDCLERMAAHLSEARQACRTHPSPEIVAVGVRQAAVCLGELVGEIYTDELLDALFGQFCIGK